MRQVLLFNALYLSGLVSACAGGSKISNTTRNLIGGSGFVTPRQEVQFEEDDSVESDDAQDGSNGNRISVAREAEPTDEQKSERVGEIVGNAAMRLVEDDAVSPTSGGNQSLPTPPGDEATETDTTNDPMVATSTATATDPGSQDDQEPIPAYTNDIVGKCKESLKLSPDSPLPIWKVTANDFAKGELNITQSTALVVFESDRNIRNLKLNFDNAEGKFCLDMRAKKLLKNVQIKSAGTGCSTNLTILRLKAHRAIKPTIIGCEGSTEGNYVEVDESTPAPTSAQIMDSCKAYLKNASDNQIKYYPIDFAITKNMRIDVPEQYAVIDFKNAEKINKLELNLDHPDGKYCVDVSAVKQIKKISFLTRCPDPMAQTAPEVIGLTADGRKVKKLNFKLCTSESRQAVETKIKEAKADIDASKKIINEIRKDKSLTAKEKKSQIAAEKAELKALQKEKNASKKDLRKMKK